MTAIAQPALDTKHCPICSQVLPLTEFGVCRSRKDGHNLYCRGCIRKKVTDSRRAIKAYKSIREQSSKIIDSETPRDDDESNNELPPGQHHYVTRQLNRMTPAERVREAIRKGAKTQKEIAQATRLGKDEIGDALANLLLWTREIRTEVVDNGRRYLINEAAVEPVFGDDENYNPNLPARKRDVPSSFSALSDLMPGKKPQGEQEKPGSWVAA
jgi:hypothetical protein